LDGQWNVDVPPAVEHPTIRRHLMSGPAVVTYSTVVVDSVTQMQMQMQMQMHPSDVKACK